MMRWPRFFFVSSVCQVWTLPCGSRSIKMVFLPFLDNPAARLMAVVVLPTPPFWLYTAIFLMHSPRCCRCCRWIGGCQVELCDYLGDRDYCTLFQNIFISQRLRLPPARNTFSVGGSI